MYYWLKLFLVLSLGGLFACTETPDQPLRIGSSPWPGYEPLYLARDLGYLDDIKINLFELPSSDITLESFRNRSTDVATLTLDGILELLSEGVRLKIILIMDISHGGDVALAAPEIKTLKDLKGKRVAAVNIPLGVYMVSRMLDKAGLKRKDIELSLMAETQQEAIYAQGKADVIVTYDPVKTKLQNAGMKVLFDSADIPNEIFDILVVHNDVYKNRKQDLCRLVDRWFKAIEYIKDNQQDAAHRISRRLGVTVAEYHDMMRGIIIPDKSQQSNFLGGEKPGIYSAAEKLHNIMLKENMLKDTVNYEHTVDSSFVECSY